MMNARKRYLRKTANLELGHDIHSITPRLHSLPRNSNGNCRMSVNTDDMKIMMTWGDFKKHLQYMHRSGVQDMIGNENFASRLQKVKKKLEKEWRRKV